MSKRLEGKVAIVTGAATGMGRAFSLAMAREGASVVAVDIKDAIDTKARAEKLGLHIHCIKADISEEKDTLRFAEEANKKFGKIDILVNNAGLFPLTPFDQLTYADWRKVLSVNVDGTFLCVKAVVPYMKAKKYGRIINISSTTFMLGFPNFLPYVTSKGAIIGMTRSLSSELGDDGITVNSIAPGPTDTEGLMKIANIEAIWDVLVASQSIKRRETSDDIIGALIFFASEDSSFITGQTLVVDGGMVKY